MKIVIDTNVVVDALASREPWNESAEKIFIMAATHMVQMCITASSATDIYYLVRKYLHSAEQAKLVVKKLYLLMEILEVTGQDCRDALESAISDYEDAVIERVAKNADMDYIITRNVKDYRQSAVKVMLPDEFISFMEEKG